MARLIYENDVYALFKPNGTAKLHVGDIDRLPRIEVVEAEVKPQEWIPVSERMPTAGDANEDGEVLAVWIGEKVMDPSPKICGESCAQYWGYVARHPEYFSHWMPFPVPPKEE